MPITMQERLDHAADALRGYRVSKCEPSEADFEDTDASDLISDLLHLQKHLGFDIKLTVERAMMHFEAEQADEAAYTVGGSHGELTINRGGIVTARQIDEPGSDNGRHIASILSFDLAEWRQYWRVDFYQHFDILDLGYWYVENGERKYVDPDAVWRREIAEILLQRTRGDAAEEEIQDE